MARDQICVSTFFNMTMDDIKSLLTMSIKHNTSKKYQKVHIQWNDVITNSTKTSWFLVRFKEVH